MEIGESRSWRKPPTECVACHASTGQARTARKRASPEAAKAAERFATAVRIEFRRPCGDGIPRSGRSQKRTAPAGASAACPESASARPCGGKSGAGKGPCRGRRKPTTAWNAWQSATPSRPCGGRAGTAGKGQGGARRKPRNALYRPAKRDPVVLAAIGSSGWEGCRFRRMQTADADCLTPALIRPCGG